MANPRNRKRVISSPAVRRNHGPTIPGFRDYSSTYPPGVKLTDLIKAVRKDFGSLRDVMVQSGAFMDTIRIGRPAH